MNYKEPSRLGLAGIFLFLKSRPIDVRVIVWVLVGVVMTLAFYHTFCWQLVADGEIGTFVAFVTKPLAFGLS